MSVLRDMGDLLAKPILFPAPLIAHPESKYIIWEEAPEGTPGGGQRRPFLWLPTLGDAESRGLPAKTIVYFHANAEDLGGAEEHLTLLRRHLRVNVLAVEYPGYGLCPADRTGCSTGAASVVQGIDHAGMHAVRWLVTSKGMPAGQIVLHGHSIGTGPALRLAKYVQETFRWSVGGVILQSPFTSIQNIARDYAGAAGALLIPNYYDNMETLRSMCSKVPGSCPKPWIPLLIVHGAMDGVIPTSHGRALFEEARKLGHPSAYAAFPPTATHTHYERVEDLIGPLQHFLNFRVGRDRDRERGSERFTSLMCVAPSMCIKPTVPEGATAGGAGGRQAQVGDAPTGRDSSGG